MHTTHLHATRWLPWPNQGVLLLLCKQVSKLEAEAEQLQSNLVQSQQTVNTLERRLAGMEAELVEHQQRVSCQPTVVELLEIC